MSVVMSTHVDFWGSRVSGGLVYPMTSTFSTTGVVAVGVVAVGVVVAGVVAVGVVLVGEGEV
ncbi:MAG: hypothetical protein J7J11_00390, partial [Desulfurococcales archaeon]|nr:hypothetical protein [Desulfurococcales archaeon]